MKPFTIEVLRKGERKELFKSKDVAFRLLATQAIIIEDGTPDGRPTVVITGKLGSGKVIMMETSVDNMQKAMEVAKSLNQVTT